MTKISYNDEGGRFRLVCDGHAERVNGDDHNVICACVSAVVLGLLSALPEDYVYEQIVSDDGDSVEVKSDAVDIRIAGGYAAFDVAPDEEDAPVIRACFETAFRALEWIEREWPTVVEISAN